MAANYDLTNRSVRIDSGNRFDDWCFLKSGKCLFDDSNHNGLTAGAAIP